MQARGEVAKTGIVSNHKVARGDGAKYKGIEGKQNQAK